MIQLNKPFTQIAGFDNLRHLILKMKLKRIPYICVASLVFQISNLINPSCEKTSSILAGIYTLIAVSGFFFFFVLAFLNWICDSEHRIRLVTVIYLCLFLAGMIPFVVRDIQMGLFPINATVACIALVMSPSIGWSESVGIMMLFVGANLSLAWIYNAGTTYFLALLCMTVTVFLVSLFIQEQYIAIIRALNTEALMDPLTGLMNRKGAFEKLNLIYELCGRHGKKIAVYMIDIDLFKHYNDQYGHTAGDEALKCVAASVKSVFSRSSDVVCRYGGEEFLIATSINLDHAAEELAEKLRGKVEAASNPERDPLTVSIGFTIGNPTGDHIDSDAVQLIERADQALYQAKNSGRNRVCHL